MTPHPPPPVFAQVLSRVLFYFIFLTWTSILCLENHRTPAYSVDIDRKWTHSVCLFSWVNLEVYEVIVS